MKHKRGFFLAFIVILLFSQISLSYAQEGLRITRADAAREYFPGDFVHVIVEAPVDTAQITAIMPDGATVSLVQERRTNVWRGIWQVPIDFKKGVFAAKLTAIDIIGNVFEGQTDSFAVKELAMITLVGKPTLEAPAPVPFRERIIVEAPPKGAAEAAAEEEIAKIIRKLIAQPVAGPVPELKATERSKLIDRNIESGKDRLEQGKLTEAAAYFRIVLFLAPEQKEAGSYLAETLQKLNEEKGRRRQMLFLYVAGFFAAFIALIVLIRAFPGKKAAPAPAAAAMPEKSEGISEKEKTELWHKKIGWSGNPFNPDIFKQIFMADNNLEFEGLKNFLKARIESAGGKDALPFTEAALEKIHALSKGKPKAALKICNWAVNQAALANAREISAELISEYEKIAPMRILVADDEEVIRESLGDILKRGGGYDVDFASDGEEVMKKAKENTYNLILLDIVMPKLDGYEILKQIRAVYHDLPVVFISGKGESDKVMQSLSQYSLSGYIEKPFSLENVLDIIARSLKRK